MGDRPVSRPLPTIGVRWLAWMATHVNDVVFRASARGRDDPTSDSVLWTVALVFGYVCITLLAAVLAILGGSVLARAPTAIHDVLFDWVIRLIMVFGFAGMAINGVRFEVLFYRRKAQRENPYVSDQRAHRRVPFLLSPTDLDLAVQAIVALGITLALAA